PEALASALATLSEAPDAENPTDPPDAMLVDVVANTLSSTIAIAKAAPTAALPPDALPDAVVKAVDSCAAVTATLPVVARPPVKAPTVACVSSSTSDNATTGVTAIPPAEPWSACVTTP